MRTRRILINLVSFFDLFGPFTSYEIRQDKGFAKLYGITLFHASDIAKASRFNKNMRCKRLPKSLWI